MPFAQSSKLAFKLCELVAMCTAATGTARASFLRLKMGGNEFDPFFLARRRLKPPAVASFHRRLDLKRRDFFRCVNQMANELLVFDAAKRPPAARGAGAERLHEGD